MKRPLLAGLLANAMLLSGSVSVISWATRDVAGPMSVESSPIAAPPSIPLAHVDPVPPVPAVSARLAVRDAPARATSAARLTIPVQKSVPPPRRFAGVRRSLAGAPPRAEAPSSER